MRQMDFKLILKPKLMEVYDGLTCTDNECWLDQACKDVPKNGVQIALNIGPKLEESVPLFVGLDKHMVDGMTIGVSGPKCYVPIFAADPGAEPDVWTTFFLGNMFLDQFLVVHDMEGAKIGGAMPKVGIYDKLNPHIAPDLTPVDPKPDPDPKPDDPKIPDYTGPSFWTILLIVIILAAVIGFIFFLRKDCLNRGGDSTFQTGSVNENAGLKTAIK